MHGTNKHFSGFDWHSLPYGSTIVDVGGGIGSSSMMLASVFSATRSDAADQASMEGRSEALGFKFVVQDRPVVCEMGEKVCILVSRLSVLIHLFQAWRDKCPELLNTVAHFQGKTYSPLLFLSSLSANIDRFSARLLHFSTCQRRSALSPKSRSSRLARRPGSKNPFAPP